MQRRPDESARFADPVLDSGPTSASAPILPRLIAIIMKDERLQRSIPVVRLL
jgi:hypothetical protein